MADTFDTKPDNFSASGSSVTKYLDLAGLQEFWSRSKDYIDNQDSKLHNQLKAIHDKIKDISGLDIDDLLVIGKGDANNSAVLNGEYEGYSNKAISQTSMALGAATTAGLKGWYYSKIEFGANPVITLSDKQPSVVLGYLGGGAWSSGTPNIAVGDKISIVNNSKYDYCGEVKSISGNKITLKSALPFDSLATSLISTNDPDDWTIYLPERANAGIIDMGGGAFAEGVNTQATNIGAHAEGIQTHAYGQYSHTEGFRTEAGYAAHAEGRSSIASGQSSHAEGNENTASGNASHAEGGSTIASGKFAHAEGNTTIASGNASHTEGYQTEATNNQSHAEGGSTHATGKQSHAEGWSTTASGDHSHTEGGYTIASGKQSHAGGNTSIAGGARSFAHGNHVETSNADEVAFGKYNKSTSGSTLFSIGNGTSDTNRKNAFEVKTDNTAYVNGKQIATLNDIPAVDTELNPDSNNPIANSVVANAIKGGVHFRGVYKTLPTVTEITDEVTEETVTGWIDPVTADVHVFDVGDIIIVEPAGGYPDTISEPTLEYILTFTDADHRYKWVELGDVTPAQNMINESLKNYYKKSETYKKSEVDSKFVEYVPQDTYTDSYSGDEIKRVIIHNQDLYENGYSSDLYRTSEVAIEPHKIILGAHEDYMDDENGTDEYRSNTLELSAEHGLRLNDNEVLTADDSNNLSKSELKIGQVEISNSDQQPNYTFNGRVVLDDMDHETLSIVAEWDGNDPSTHLHPYMEDSIDVCKFIITSINWEGNAHGTEENRHSIEDMLLTQDGKLLVSVECLNDPTIEVDSYNSWIDADIYDPSTGSINGTITATMPYSLKKLSKLTVNGNEVLAVDSEGVLDKNTLIITDGGYNHFAVDNEIGLIANHIYEMDGETMSTMLVSSPIEGVEIRSSYASDQVSAQCGFIATGQTVGVASIGENKETGESMQTMLVVTPAGATINDQPILTGTRIEDSKILSLFL